MKRLPPHFRPFVVIAFILASPTSQGLAQDASAPPTPAPDLNQITGQLESQDTSLKDEANRLRLLIEGETIAHRLEPQTAIRMIESLRRVGSAMNDVQLEAAMTEVTSDDETIQIAQSGWKAFVERLAAERTKLVPEAYDLGRERVVEIGQTATKATEIASILDTLQRLQSSFEKHYELQQVKGGFRTHVSILEDLQTVLRARDTGDPQLLGIALQQFLGPRQLSFGDPVPINRRKRARELLKPYFEGVEQAQSALADALLARRPAGDLTTNLAKLEKSETDLLAACPKDAELLESGSFSTDAYRALVLLAVAVENHDTAYLRLHLPPAHQTLASLKPAPSEALAALLLQWQKDLSSVTGQRSDDQWADWLGKLAAVKAPADLEAIAAELQRVDIVPAPGAKPPLPRDLGTSLNAIARAWADVNPILLQPNSRYFTTNALGESPAAAINLLRDRVQRDVLSQVLHAPELLRPPLAEESLERGLDSFAQMLSSAGEWRRLLVLLEYRGNLLSTGGPPAVTAIRSFFAGQSFELAEQWSDAILAYNSALSTGAKIGPMKEAADRLKVLTKEHPKSALSAVASALTQPPKKRQN